MLYQNHSRTWRLSQNSSRKLPTGAAGQHWFPQYDSYRDVAECIEQIMWRAVREAQAQHLRERLRRWREWKRKQQRSGLTNERAWLQQLVSISAPNDLSVYNCSRLPRCDAEVRECAISEDYWSESLVIHNLAAHIVRIGRSVLVEEVRNDFWKRRDVEVPVWSTLSINNNWNRNRWWQISWIRNLQLE